MNIFSFHVKRNFSNNPLFHFTRTHYSLRGVGFTRRSLYEPEADFPVFQHSNCVAKLS